MALGDLSPEVAKKFVLSHLAAEDQPVENDDDEQKSPTEKILTEKQRRRDLMELDACIETLGGRLTDLQVLARRLKIGQTPVKAVSEIVDESAAEILRMFLPEQGRRGGEEVVNGASVVSDQRDLRRKRA